MCISIFIQHYWQHACKSLHHMPWHLHIPCPKHACSKVPIELHRTNWESLLRIWLIKESSPSITKPSEWTSFLTYPHKPDGILLPISWDPMRLEYKAIIREHYKARILHDISHKLSSAHQSFQNLVSMMDSGASTWTAPLLTWPHSTHTRDCYQFLHMPFGLKMSQDIFKMQMDWITNRLLPGIIAIHDDICIYSKTIEQDEKHLLQLLKTPSRNDLIFNSHKCSIRQPQITFYGAIFTTHEGWSQT